MSNEGNTAAIANPTFFWDTLYFIHCIYWHERWFRKRVSGKLKWPLKSFTQGSSFTLHIAHFFRGDYFSTRRKGATVLKF